MNLRKSGKVQKKIKEPTGRSKNVKQRTERQSRVHKERPMVIRVTKDEFELSDGRIYPMMFDFADDEVPTPEEFQKQYDRWLSLFEKMELTGKDEQAVS